MKMSMQGLICGDTELDLSNFSTCHIIWMTLQLSEDLEGQHQCCCVSVVYNADHLPTRDGFGCNRNKRFHPSF